MHVDRSEEIWTESAVRLRFVPHDYEFAKNVPHRLQIAIFNGLAVSLIFGILVSTLLTLVVIPVLYYALFRRRMAANTATPVPSSPTH